MVQTPKPKNFIRGKNMKYSIIILVAVLLAWAGMGIMKPGLDTVQKAKSEKMLALQEINQELGR